MKALLILTHIAVLFSFCGQNKGNTVNREVSNTSIHRDIPKGEEEDLAYQRTRQKALQLNLDPIEQRGFDSLQIRFWLNYSMAIKNHLVVMKYTEGIWKGTIVTYEVDDEHDSLVTVKETKNITPASGWIKFWKHLQELGVMTISDQKSSGADGTSYCMEIATADKYRFFRSWSPDLYQDNPDDKKMATILKLLEQEFRFQRNQL